MYQTTVMALLKMYLYSPQCFENYILYIPEHPFKKVINITQNGIVPSN